MQGQKGVGDPPWGQAMAEDELAIKPVTPDYDVHESMRLGGAKDVSEELVQEADSKAAQDGRRARALCCCRVPGCPIGPFTEIEEY